MPAQKQGSVRPGKKLHISFAVVQDTQLLSRDVSDEELDEVVHRMKEGEWLSRNEKDKKMLIRAIKEGKETVFHCTTSAGIRLRVTMGHKLFGRPTDVLCISAADPDQPEFTRNRIYTEIDKHPYGLISSLLVKYPGQTPEDCWRERLIPPFEQLSMITDHVSEKKNISETNATWHESSEGQLIMIVSEWKAYDAYAVKSFSLFVVDDVVPDHFLK